MANTSIPLPGLSTIERGIAAGGAGVTNPGPSVPQVAKGVSGAVETATTAVPDFLSRLTSGNLWMRIGEVMLGLALIIVGLEKMTSLNVTGNLAKVGKAAAIA